MQCRTRHFSLQVGDLSYSIGSRSEPKKEKGLFSNTRVGSCGLWRCDCRVSVHHDIAETSPCRILLFVRANSLVSEFDVLKQGTSALKLRAVAGETWSLEDTGALIPALKLLAPISLAHHLQSHPSGNPSTWFPFITKACRCFCIRLQFGGMIAKTMSYPCAGDWQFESNHKYFQEFWMEPTPKPSLNDSLKAVPLPRLFSIWY